MSDVMRQCDQGQLFDIYATCIRSKYDKEGAAPNDQLTRAFYANMDEINEAYKTGSITSAQAKSSLYKAYMTIDGSNEPVAEYPSAGEQGFLEPQSGRFPAERDEDAAVFHPFGQLIAIFAPFAALRTDSECSFLKL